MVEDLGVPRDRIKLIPRSVDIECFRYINPREKKHKGFNVGIIGRITPLKGHMYFMKAMAKVAKEIPNLKIWVVGEVPVSKEAYKEQLELLVKRLGLWPHTEFLGTQRDIPGILEHLDVLVMATTTQEAFGRVIIEAQAAGVPVVATRVGGVVDIIEDNKNGLLVPPADPVRMAQAVVRLYKDKDLAEKISQAALLKTKNNYNITQMVESTLEVYQQALESKRILLIKLSALGDVVLATASLRALRHKFGQKAYLCVLVSNETKEVFLNCPYLDELLVCDFKFRDQGIIGLWNLGRLLRNKSFDMVFDLQNNRKSHILAALSFAAERFGYARKLGFLLNRKIKEIEKNIPPVEHQFKVLGLAGIMLTDSALELWPTLEQKKSAEDFLAQQWVPELKMLVGLSLSASLRWPAKNWPVAQLKKFIELLAHRDIRVLLTGTEEDNLLAQQLILDLKNTKLINACGKTTINELAWLIKQCAVFVSADSAPLHIAAAMKVPIVALFGPTDSRRHLPPVKDAVVIEKDIECRPCYHPKCKDVRCMNLIKPEEVVDAVLKFLP